MGRRDDPLLALLPLARVELLGAAIGRELLEIDRRTAVTLDRHVQAYGGDASDYFARASGPATFWLSGGLVHSLAGFPSELSITVEDRPPRDHPDLEVVRLSESTASAPAWLRECVGRRVVDVRAYVYREEGVDSPEARQCAVSYVLEPDREIVYCTWLHGRMDGDELVEPAEIDRSVIARCVSLAALRR